VARLTESEVEQAALAWFESLGYTVKAGPDIAPDGSTPERGSYVEVVLHDRLRQALALLNPTLPAEALEDAFRRLTRPEGATLEARNRAFHRMVTDGVTVEYRKSGGAIAGAQVRVLDFDDPERNDWLVLNQFTVAEHKHTRRLDVVVFVNGLPLALIELKNAAAESATIWTAFQQLQTYKGELHHALLMQRSPRRVRRSRGADRHASPPAVNGSSRGGRSRARRSPTRISPSCR
jgi:type I restriction enzyme R subunit